MSSSKATTFITESKNNTVRLSHGARALNKYKEYRKPELYEQSYWLLQGARSMLFALSVTSYIYRQGVQECIDDLWQYLLASKIYNSVYFETIFTTFCYGVIIAIYPFTIHYIRSLDKYKIDPSVTYQHKSIIWLVGKAI